MKLLKLKVRNLFAYEKASIDFTKYNGLILIKGRNNSGKSALIRSISYILFDSLVEMSRPSDDIIRKGNDYGYGELIFKIGKVKYKITRGRKKSKPFVIFENLTKKKKLTERKKEDTNAKIIEKIGMNFRIAKNSIMFGQGDNSRFVHLKDSGRKEIFCSLIKELREIDEEYLIVKSKADKLEDELNDLMLDSGFPERTETSIKVAKDKINKHKKEEKKKREKITELENKMGRSVSKKYKKIKKKLGNINQSLKTNESLKEHYIENHEFLIVKEKGQIKRSKDKLNTIRYGICPECKQFLDKEHKDSKKESIKNEIIVGKKKIRECKKKIRDKKILFEERKKKLKKERKEEKKELLRYSKSAIDGERRVLEKYKEENKSLSENQAELKFQENELKQFKVQLKKELKSKGKIKKLQSKVTRLGMIERALSNKGIRQDIIDDLIPVFEEKIKYYLNQLCDGISVRLSTTVKSKTDDRDIDKFSILVFNGKTEVNYELIGSGIKKAIQIAFSFALSDFAMEQSSIAFDFILLDEVFGELDENTRSNLINLLKGLSKRFRNIIIISHIPEIQDMIKDQIEIVQTNGVSKIL